MTSSAGSDAPDTVTEAVALLEAEGYTADFRITADGIRCSACGESHPTSSAIVERIFRFEGPSDPADEAIVFGLRCAECGAKGLLVSAFGPDADPEVLTGLTILASRG